jgi:hypothetical protein
MKTDNSLECCSCGTYNLEQAIVIDGEIYCWDCITGKNLYLRQKIKKDIENEKYLKIKNLKGGIENGYKKI